MNRAPWAVVVDFDGTATLGDTADAILVRFAARPEAAFERHYRTGIVTEAWVYDKYRAVRTPVETVREFALETASMRADFDRLAETCRASGMPFEVVSGGLDLYLDPLLERWGLAWVPRFRAFTRETPKGLYVRYRFLPKGVTLDAFKASRVRWHRDRGFKALFIGDGPSDLLAAREADAVFARGELARLCRRSKVPFRRLEVFGPVIRFLSSKRTRPELR